MRPTIFFSFALLGNVGMAVDMRKHRIRKRARNDRKSHDHVSSGSAKSSKSDSGKSSKKSNSGSSKSSSTSRPHLRRSRNHLNIFQTRDCVSVRSSNSGQDSSSSDDRVWRRRYPGSKGKGGKGESSSKSRKSGSSKTSKSASGHGYHYRPPSATNEYVRYRASRRTCPPGYIHRDDQPPAELATMPSASPTITPSTVSPTSITIAPSPGVATTPSPTALATIPPTIVESMDPSCNGSAFWENMAIGDRALGHCYFVDVEVYCICIDPETQCHDYLYRFGYYNGGTYFTDSELNGEREVFDTGQPREGYEGVSVEGRIDCNDGTPDSCTISVEGKGTCNSCTFDRERRTFSLIDCSNLADSPFPEGVENSFEYYVDGALPPYEFQFLFLEFDQQRCDNYAFP